MCGIIGTIRDNISIDDIKKFNNSLSLMQDRGPDNQNIKRINKNILVGHSRLSIIDISTNANQPFQIENYTIVFNGEIYNYLFLKEVLNINGIKCNASSDTEILLRYYIQFGIDKTLADINGMFAFCIVDTNANKSYLARDRFGQKPLFINTEYGISFSSTIESLKSISNRGDIDREVIYQYLLFRFIQSDDTVYGNIIKINPAECVVVDLTTQTVIKKYFYWKPKYKLSSDTYKLDTIEKILEDSVKEHMYSDVPMALFLSGGIDSSLISYYATKQNKNLESINVQFKGQENNEYQYAKYVSDKLNISLHKVEIDKFSDTTFDDVQLLLQKVGQPFSDPALLPQYLVAKKAKDLGFKVVLTGDGGDELFGGYSIYRKAQLFRYAKYSPNFLYKDFKTIQDNNEQLIYFNLNIMEIDEIRNTMGKIPIFDLVNNKEFILEKNDYMKLFSSYDINYKLANEFLPKVDTATMLTSVESRSPFLNHKLFEYVWQHNYNNLASFKEGKLPLKNISEKIYGKKFTYRKKMGFEAAMEEWLSNNKTIFNHTFSKERKIFKDGVLNFDNTKELVIKYKKFLWRYFNLITWYENEN